MMTFEELLSALCSLAQRPHTNDCPKVMDARLRCECRSDYNSARVEGCKVNLLQLWDDRLKVVQPASAQPIITPAVIAAPSNTQEVPQGINRDVFPTITNPAIKLADEQPVRPPAKPLAAPLMAPSPELTEAMPSAPVTNKPRTPAGPSRSSAKKDAADLSPSPAP